MQILGSTVSSTSAVTEEEGAGTWLTFATVMKSPVMLSFWCSTPSPNPSSPPPPLPYVWALPSASPGGGSQRGRGWHKVVVGLICGHLWSISHALGLSVLIPVLGELPGERGSWGEGDGGRGMGGGKLCRGCSGCAGLCLSPGHRG